MCGACALGKSMPKPVPQTGNGSASSSEQKADVGTVICYGEVADKASATRLRFERPYALQSYCFNEAVFGSSAFCCAFDLFAAGAFFT